jgi:hypothetical protein
LKNLISILASKMLAPLQVLVCVISLSKTTLTSFGNGSRIVVSPRLSRFEVDIFYCTKLSKTKSLRPCFAVYPQRTTALCPLSEIHLLILCQG